jgi:hypothetical protein
MCASILYTRKVSSIRIIGNMTISGMQGIKYPRVSDLKMIRVSDLKYLALAILNDSRSVLKYPRVSDLK